MFPALARAQISGVLFIVVLALLGTSSCIHSRLKGTSSRPVETGMEVIVQSAIERRLMDSIGVFPFGAPPETETAGMSEKATAAFQLQLVRKRPFREVRQIDRPVKSDTEALWYGRTEGCDLVMVPTILYVMDGSGALPTRVGTRTRILDARTGFVLWDIKQTALSEPGPDVDLTWNTISGEPAQRFPELAEALARNFTDFLIQPLERAKLGYQ